MVEHKLIIKDLELLLFGKQLDYAQLDSKLIHIFGEAGTGKSTLATQLLCNFALNKKKGILIDTEGKITGSKIKGVLQGENIKKISSLMKLYRPASFQEQHDLILDLEFFLTNQEIGILIIDTITNFYRQETNQKKKDKIAYRKLAYQVAHLQKLSRKYNFPVVLFNQATMKKRNLKEKDDNITYNRINPVAKSIVSYWMDNEIILVKHGFGNFEAYNSGEMKGKVKFTIDSQGIKKIN